MKELVFDLTVIEQQRSLFFINLRSEPASPGRTHKSDLLLRFCVDRDPELTGVDISWNSAREAPSLTSSELVLNLNFSH